MSFGGLQLSPEGSQLPSPKSFNSRDALGDMRGKSGRTAGEVFWRPLLAFEAMPLSDGISSGWLVTISEGAPVLLSLVMAVSAFAWDGATLVLAVSEGGGSPFAFARLGSLVALPDWAR